MNHTLTSICLQAQAKVTEYRAEAERARLLQRAGAPSTLTAMSLHFFTAWPSALHLISIIQAPPPPAELFKRGF